MIQAQPGLLDADSAAIRGRLQALADSLDSCRGARTCARSMPVLLVSDRVQGLPSHMDQLGTVLALHERADIARAAIREPLLLVMTSNEVAARLQAVSQCFKLVDASLQATAERCALHPWLLTMSSSSLERKLTRLCRALELSRDAGQRLAAAYPPILHQSSESVEAKVKLLLNMTKLPREGLACMMFRQPSVLCRSVDKLQRIFHAVRDVTMMSNGDVVRVMEKRPSILVRHVSMPSRCYRALSIWRMSQEEKHALITAHPLLLQLSPREVHFRCRWLREFIGSNGFYHSALRRLPPSLLGSIILHLPHHWSRLQYLSETNQEGSMQLTDMLRINGGSTFDAQFPEYRIWLQYKISEMVGSECLGTMLPRC